MTRQRVLEVDLIEGGQEIRIDTSVWSDPAAWGMLLADVARHGAAAYSQSSGNSIDAALERIKLGFDVEMNNPTDNSASG